MKPNSSFFHIIIDNSYKIIPHKLNPSAKAYLGKKIITNERLAIKFERKYFKI